MAKKAKGFIDQVVEVYKKDTKGVLIPTTFLALGILDVIPTPTDIGYFYTEKWLIGKEADPNYWIYKGLNYYGWDFLWYITLFGVTYYGGKNMYDKLKLGIGVMSAGAIIYLAWKFTAKPVEASDV